MRKKFEDISNAYELIENLKTKAKSMQDKQQNSEQLRYVYHYTKAKAVKSILESKKWYLNSPSNMNDGLELMHLNSYGVSLENLFFACFITTDKDNEKESIAMWSMYSQPWEEGVLIKIPVANLKAWVNEKPSIYITDRKERKAQEKLENIHLELHSVAYTNADSKEGNEPEILQCGGKENYLLSDIHQYKELAGYIKDTAWSYEKELRLRVDVPANKSCNAVMIDIPQDVLDSFLFVTGPRFSGNLLSQIRKIDPKFNEERITPSLFTGRLNWVYCDVCDRK